MDGILNVSEIFLSLQGEGTRTGLPCVLARLAGCNLRCNWCDTAYTQPADSGTDMNLQDVLARIESFGVRRVELTGGEPLIQPASRALLRRLCEAGYETLLETNGSISLKGLDERVVKVMDWKCPSSGHADCLHPDNLGSLTSRDEIKFVLADRGDYEFARRAVRERKLIGRLPVIFSPVLGHLNPADLAAWVLEDRLDVRVGLQLHKIIWPGKDRGV